MPDRSSPPQESPSPADFGLADLVVPPPDAVADLTMADGAPIRLRRYGQAGRPRLALSHGNGLAIDAYAPFWLPLASEFELVLFDVRNHGHNALHKPESHSWATIFDDFEAIFHGIQDAFGAAPTAGVFHSMSAIAAIRQTLDRGPRWAALALFDPPIAARPGHPLQHEHDADMAMMSSKAARRPERYPYDVQFARQLSRLPQFARLVPEGPMLLARHTLRKSEAGDFILRNPRELEAHIYITQTDESMWPQMANMSVPTILIAGDPDASTSPAAKIAAAMHQDIGIGYAMVPDTTHFLQLEKPEECRVILIDFLKRSGFPR
jgi:pimeloyl-ACP methyl ester carboxylesterase